MLLVLLVGSTGGTRVGYAQTPPTHPVDAAEGEVRYTLALVGVPLLDALERLVDASDLSLVYESVLVAGKTTFCRAERVPAEGLLACILEGTGLDFVRLSSGTYVLVRDPRAEPQVAPLIGQVVDAQTGAPLAGANVLLADAGTGTATNSDGRFSFPALLPGPHRLIVTHVAYHDAADSVYIRPERASHVAVSLRPRVVLSAPVVVSGFHARLPSDALGAASRTADELALTGPGGSPDLVQALDAVVGVRLGDALSDVHVQGGAADEQPFLLDGVPVYMPVPNGGFVGPFSPFAVGRVTVQKAGFGASHGSGLSGVIEVEHQLGSPDRRGLAVQVDPFSLNGRLNGQAGSAEALEARWMLALRQGLWDYHAPARLEALFRRWAQPDRFLYDALQRQDAPGAPATLPDVVPDGPLEVGFRDVHAATRLRMGGLRSLYASFYDGTGAFGIDDAPPREPSLGVGAEDVFNEDLFEDAYHWHNRTLQLRYEWVQSRRLFLNAGAWTTGYELVHPVTLQADTSRGTASDEFNSLAEAGVRLSGDVALSANHHLAGAVEAVHTRSDFALSLDPFGAAPAGPDDIRPVPLRLAAFLEDRQTVGRLLTLTYGMRLTYLPALQRAFGEPRLAVQVDRETGSRGSVAVRAAVGRYRQYLHAFDVATYNVTSLLPRMRFWLPVGKGQRPPDVYHATAAVLYRPVPRWQLGAETYYKHQPHLLVLDYGSAPTADGDVLTKASGRAYGAALSASYTRPRLQLDGQYEYAVARRRTPGRFGGRLVPVPWDAPYRLHLALDLRPAPRWTATLRWQGVFGRSWGFRQAYYDFLEPHPATRQIAAFDLADPAAHRLPAFSQLDVGLAYTRTVRGLDLQGRLGALNLLGRDNVSDWSLRQDGTAETYGRDARLGTPFLPTFSVRLGL